MFVGELSEDWIFFKVVVGVGCCLDFVVTIQSELDVSGRCWFSVHRQRWHGTLGLTSEIVRCLRVGCSHHSEGCCPGTKKKEEKKLKQE